MSDMIQVRRDLASNWALVNPILAQGEPGLELDTRRIKYGDGISRWGELPYYFEIKEVAPGLVTQDSTHRFVTDLQVAAWTAKQEALGYVPENVACKGAAGGYAPIGPDGKIPDQYMPAIAISDTFVASTEAEMLAAAAQRGDVCVRQDLSQSYILKGTNPAVLADWQVLLTPANPVQSVNGKTGVVVLVKADVGLSNVQNVDTTSASNIASGTLSDARLSTNVTLAGNTFNGANQLFKLDGNGRIAATYITEDSTHRFATDTEKAAWNSKQAALGYTPENSANKGLANGYAPLGSDVKIPVAYIPTITVAGENVTQDAAHRMVTDTQISAWAGKQEALGYTPENSANRGVAGGYAPVGLDGKIPTSYIPASAITDTFVVSSQSEMLALTAQTGDVAVRQDLSQSLILKGADPTVLSNWQVLLTPGAPVQSVNGKTGVITLVKADIGLGNVQNVDTTNAGNISAGILADARLSTNVTLAGNSFNGVSQLVKTDSAGKLPVLDGSQLSGLTKAQVGLGSVANADTTNAGNISAGTLADARLSTNVTLQGNAFNAANQLVKLNATGQLPAVDGSLLNLGSNVPLLNGANTFTAVNTHTANVLIGTATDGMTAGGSLAVQRDFAHRGSLLGFYGTTPRAKQSLATLVAGMGTVGTGLSPVGAGWTGPTATIVNNNFRRLADAVNAIRTLLVNYGLSA